jgi:hypothetical protein
MILNKKVVKTFRESLGELKRSGLLLLADNRLPSITTIVAGKPIRGSWWGHPKGREIFHVVCQIADHPDVAVTKLISGKVTFVHRKLWPALLTIGTAREPWQMKGLSRKARSLLQIVDRKGEVRTDRLPVSPRSKRSACREAIRELESRLLVYGEEFHSESGAHAKRLESWKHWEGRVGLNPAWITTELARHEMEKAAQKIARGPSEIPKLPWMKKLTELSMEKI